MVKHIYILLVFILSFLPICLIGQITVKDTINLSKGIDNAIFYTLRLDTIQVSDITFQMILENTSSHSLLVVENPLLSLELILIEEKSRNQVALKNANNLVLIEGHGQKKDQYDTQNKSFKISNITSNLNKKTTESWYERKWTLLPSEKVNCVLTVKHVSLFSEKNEAYIFKENQYKTIENGKYTITVHNPLKFYGENGKIIGFTTFISRSISVTLE